MNSSKHPSIKFGIPFSEYCTWAETSITDLLRIQYTNMYCKTRSTQTAQTSAERQHNRIVAVLPGSGRSGMDSQIRIVMQIVTKM